VRNFGRHQATIDQIAWSRNDQHIVSLDSSYQVKVWDTVSGQLKDEFLAPGPNLKDEFFAENAGVAISDDGNRVAYASGGEQKAWGQLRDVTGHNTIGTWELPGAFERLACTEGNRFILVREEKEDRQEFKGDKKAWPLQTVVYDFSDGMPCKREKPIRLSREGDYRRFFGQVLTPDGRYYSWVGPRITTRDYRVEVIEVATGELITRVPVPKDEAKGEPTALLDPTGRHLWINRGYPDIDHYDLHNPEQKEGVAWYPGETSKKAGLQVEEHFLHLINKDNPWLQLTKPGLSNLCNARFSHDGRRLAWGSESGQLTVVDIEKLREEIAAFERQVQEE
jgi:WD40 repeat protein